ncbi:hypothetical protein [Gulosibacter faecalis]|uniref:DUF4333 domain-containing protein n=1 Tax=Gulosibacter faecalis TaxID=272240 RepID=A0ABW5UVW3_9MICO|nr:hypothetical protein [Gulosibacter faecalis]
MKPTREPARWLLPAGIAVVLAVLAVVVVTSLLPKGPSEDEVIEACAADARSQLENPRSAYMLNLAATQTSDTEWIAGGQIDAETASGSRITITMTCAVTINGGEIDRADASLSQ